MSRLVFILGLAVILSACESDGAKEWESCTKSSDCAGDLLCKEGVCLKPEQQVSCLIDAQCPAGLTCVNGVCSDGTEQPPECSATVPCADGLACVKGSCIDGGTPAECSKDGDCKDGQVCAAGKCEAAPEAECTEDEDCPSGNCDKESGQCLGAACQGDEDCPEGTCNTESGTCDLPEVGCQSDDDCESGLCDSGTGKCIEDAADCQEDGECNDDDACTEDSCQEGKCKNVHIASESCCLSDNDCVPANACQAISCQDFSCESQAIADCCLEDAECDDGNAMTQDLCEENVCANPGLACYFDADCDDGNACTIDTCKQQHCENPVSADPLCCLVDEECDDGKPETTDSCVDFQCVFKSETCVNDIDCADSNPCTSEACNQGVCEVSVITEPQCACAADGDCMGKGNTCTLQQLGPLSMGLFCGEPEGTKLAGESCTKDADCKSGYCASFDDGKICFGPCKSDMDCKGGTSCGTVNLTLAQDVVQSFDACVIPPDQCKGDQSCAGGQVCLPAQNPDVLNTIIGICGPSIGSKTAGSICSKDEECQSGVCFNLIEKGINICWSMCAHDQDCLPGLYCYENLVYFVFDQDTPNKMDDKYYSVRTCSPNLGSFQACWADSDCPGNEFCSTYSNQSMTALEPKCITAKGNSPAGSSCSSNTQCKSDWCNSPPGFCVGLCKSTGDCSGGAICDVIDFTLNDKGDQVPAHICLP